MFFPLFLPVTDPGPYCSSVIFSLSSVPSVAYPFRMPYVSSECINQFMSVLINRTTLHRRACRTSAQKAQQPDSQLTVALRLCQMVHYALCSADASNVVAISLVV